MKKLINQLKSQRGMYSIVFVAVISLIFLIVSLNLSKNVQSYIQFDTVNKETLLRGRVVREIQEHLYNPSACKITFNNGSSMASDRLKDETGKTIFDLSKDRYEDRGFKEKGLPKAKKITILNCDPSRFKPGKASSVCKTPVFIKDQKSYYHSVSALQIDFLKNFLVNEKRINDPDNFWTAYIPIYLKTQKAPSSKSSQFEACSTFTPLLSNFYCSPMKFEFSCCRYIYNMELFPQKVKPKIHASIFPAGAQIYKQSRSPGDYSRIIPTADDPVGTKSSADSECYSSARKALMSGVCTFAQGWKVYTKCVK